MFPVAPQGDHVISLIDEISYMAPPAPLISQYDDINPEQFCNGDNRPANCGQNCMCTHKVDIPLNAVVEMVLVDEGILHYDDRTLLYMFSFFTQIPFYLQHLFLFSQFKLSTFPIRSTCTVIPIT